MERLTSLVLHSGRIVHSSLGLVVDGKGTDHIFWPYTASIYLLLGECWLVEPIKVFCVDRELKIVDVWFLRYVNLKLKTAFVDVRAFVEHCLPLAFFPYDLVAFLLLRGCSSNTIVLQSNGGVDFVFPAHHLHLGMKSTCVF